MCAHIAVGAVLDFLHLVPAYLYQRSGSRSYLGRGGIENYTIVEYPFGIGKEGFRRSILLSFKVFLYYRQVHGARDVVFVSWKRNWVNRSEERFDTRDRPHPGKCMLQQSTELVHIKETHGPRPSLHVFGGHDENTFWTYPILDGWIVKLNALGWAFQWSTRFRMTLFRIILKFVCKDSRNKWRMAQMAEIMSLSWRILTQAAASTQPSTASIQSTPFSVGAK